MALPPLLIDMNLPRSLAGDLTRRGIPATHATDRGLGAARDEEIVEHARARGEVVVTNDVDFGRILAVSGATRPSVVILRLRNTHRDRLGSLLATHLPRVASPIERGAIVLFEEGAIRVRSLPVGGEGP